MRRRTWMYLRPWQRHSLVLAVAGLVYICLGVIWIFVPLTDDRARGLRLALHYAPISAWAVVWILVGLLSLASTRWPPSSKTWGYAALAGLAAAWGSVYVLGAIFLDSPFSSLAGGLVYFLLAFLWWAISGLVNPDDVPKVG